MSDANVICPQCGAEIPFSEAVSRRLRDQLEADFDKQRRELYGFVAAREQKLLEDQAVLDNRAKRIVDEVSKKLDAERRKLMAEVSQRAEEKLGAQLKDLQDQIADQQSRLQQAQDAELGLRKQQRALDEATRNLELELARKLDEERNKIADEARQQGAQTERLKVAEKEHIIKSLQEQIDDLKHRAHQGSIQIQGEVLESIIENSLRQSFPLDDVREVKKGQRGGDLLQVVRTSTGQEYGAILWEAKNAKNWSSQWPEKLKADQREAKAELAVLVSANLPDGFRGIGQIDGVWVCEPAFAVALGTALRQGLVFAGVQRVQETGRTDKISRLYDFLCSVEFRQHIEGLVEAFRSLHEQLAAEQRAFARQWKEREQQISKALQHTAMLYGSIQGIAGREALPEMQTLQLPG